MNKDSCKEKDIVLTIICVLLEYYGIYYVLKIKLLPLEFDWYLFVFLIVISLCIVTYKSLMVAQRRSIIISVLGGSIVAVIECIGTNLKETYCLPVVDMSLIIAIIGMTIMFTMLNNILLTCCEGGGISLLIDKLVAGTKIEKIFLKKEDVGIRHFLLVFIVILSGWLPCFLAAYPGVFAYDAPHQLWQFVEAHQVANNQPVVSSFILFAIMKMGKILFGSYESGLSLFIVIQMMIGAGVLAYACYILRKIGMPIVLEIIGVAYFALFPVNGMFAVNANKDTLFTYFSIFIFVSIIRFLANESAYMNKRRNVISFCVGLLLVMLYRNTGVYIVASFLICFAIYLGRYRWKKGLLLGGVICVIIYNVITGPIYLMMGIGSSSISEAFSVPSQQMVNAYIKRDADFTLEEQEWFEEIFGEKSDLEWREIYHPRSADYTKLSFSEIPKHYFDLYISLLFKYPKAYVEAFLNNTFAFWYPDVHLPDPNTFPQKYIEWLNSTYDAGVKLERHSLLPILGDYYEKIGETGSYNKFNILSGFFSMGNYVIFYILVIMIMLYQKNYKKMLPVIFLGLIYGSCLLGPVAIMRYIYPIILSSPITLGLLFCKIK